MRDSGYHPKGRSNFNLALRQAFPDRQEERLRSHGRDLLIWRGIVLKEGAKTWSPSIRWAGNVEENRFWFPPEYGIKSSCWRGVYCLSCHAFFRQNRRPIQREAVSKHFVLSHGIPLCRIYAWILLPEAWQNHHPIRHLRQSIFACITGLSICHHCCSHHKITVVPQLAIGILRNIVNQQSLRNIQVNSPKG